MSASRSLVPSNLVPIITTTICEYTSNIIERIGIKSCSELFNEPQYHPDLEKVAKIDSEKVAAIYNALLTDATKVYNSLFEKSHGEDRSENFVIIKFLGAGEEALCALTGELIVFTQIKLGEGRHKTALLAIEFFTGRQFAKIVNGSAREIIIAEALKDIPGIMPFHWYSTDLVIADRFYSTLSCIKSINIQEFEIICRNLLKCLSGFHKKGYASGDLHLNNILIQRDPKTNRVVDCVIIDLEKFMIAEENDEAEYNRIKYKDVSQLKGHLIWLVEILEQSIDKPPFLKLLKYEAHIDWDTVFQAVDVYFKRVKSLDLDSKNTITLEKFIERNMRLTKKELLTISLHLVSMLHQRHCMKAQIIHISDKMILLYLNPKNGKITRSTFNLINDEALNCEDEELIISMRIQEQRMLYACLHKLFKQSEMGLNSKNLFLQVLNFKNVKLDEIIEGIKEDLVDEERLEKAKDVTFFSQGLFLPTQHQQNVVGNASFILNKYP